jgi:hypothetical protein
MTRTIEPGEDVASFLADPANGATEEERIKLFNNLAAQLNDRVHKERKGVFDTPTPAGQMEAAATAFQQDIISRLLSASASHGVGPRERWLNLPYSYPKDVVEKVMARFAAAGYRMTYGPCQAGGTAGYLYDFVAVTFPEDWLARLLSMSFRLPTTPGD